jgi:hypothetical protein
MHNLLQVVNCLLRLDPSKDLLLVDMVKPKDIRYQTNIALDDLEIFEHSITLPDSYNK